MRRFSFAFVVPGLLALAALPSCGDDTKPITKDLGRKLDGKYLDSGTPDLPVTFPEAGQPDKGKTPDKPKTIDQNTKLDKGPTVDVKKTDGSKTDGPKTDAKKTDGLKTDGAVIPPPANSTCSAPKTLTITAGIVIESSSTAGAPDEFATVDCSNSYGPWPGPQVYYKVNLTAGKLYKAQLVAGTFDASLYAFPAGTACSAAAINTACTSPTPADPTRVYNSDSIGGNESIRIAPTTTGDWIIVVDSYDATEYGPFTLTISEVVVPTNNKCSVPKTLTLAGTPAKVVETGDTSGSTDEYPTIDCGTASGYPWVGPQVYYKVTLTGGKLYKALLSTPSFDGAVYAFPAGTACSATAINTACKSPTPADPNKVYNSDGAGTGANEVVRIAPTATEDWIIVVDSYSSTEAGAFTLTVSEFVAPTNGKCATPKTLTLAGTPATVVEAGDSSDAADEFSTVSCGGAVNGAGPQLYYKVNLTGGKKYKLVVDATFDASLYAFPSATACSATAINTACTNPATADPDNIFNMDVTPVGYEVIRLAPATTGEWIVVIDSGAASDSGPFTVTVSELAPVTNGVCTAPEVLTLTTSPTTKTGDSSDGPNQFAGTITCASTTYTYAGAQLYYKVTLAAGKKYTFELAPQKWNAALYAFTDATCTVATINTQCKSPMIADSGASGIKETLVITAPATPATTDYLLAVDSHYAGVGGKFTLTATWQ